MDAVSSIIQENAVTVFFVTTALFNALIDNAIDSLYSVRHILFGGEAASLRHVSKARQFLGPGRLIHVYGPTETTIFATAQIIDHLDEAMGAVPIGKAISNTQLYVLDSSFMPVPHGVEGELYIGGDGVALGYLNRDDLTAERFASNPFREGERVYRTGDLVKWLEDGSLHFLGRRDHQVKIRGFRIELGEIEASILRHPLVKECLVTADADATGRKTLCAYIVPKQLELFSVQNLRSFLGSNLPDYMVPSSMIVLSAFVLTPNGKVDRRLLPTPVVESAQIVAARNPREAAMAQVWAEVLNCREVGIHDNFFAIGGDSIKAIQLTARLQAQGFGLRVPLLFQHQTIAELEPYLTDGMADGAEQGEVTGGLQLNPIQLWFLSSEPAQIHYFNQSIVVALDTLPSAAEVLDAVAALCAHHDALRAVFWREGDGFKSEIRGFSAQAYRLFEWQAVSVDPAELASDPSMVELQSSLDLDNGPLMAVGLIHTPTGGGGVCISIHHLVVDVVSWNVLLADFQACLEAGAKGEAPVLPLKTTSVIAWNEWLFEYAQSTEVMQSLPYWKKLAERFYVQICPDPPLAGTLAEGLTASLILDAKVSDSVAREANRAFGTEPQHLLLCALGLALSEWRGQGDYLLNLEGHGRDGLRNLPDVGRTVGWFTAAYPFALSASLDLGEALKQVKESLRTVPGKGMDYGLLVYLTRELAATDRACLKSLTPQIGFNFLGNLDTLPGLDDGVHVLGRAVTASPALRLALPLDIVASLRGGRIELEALFDSTRLAPSEVDSFLAVYREKLVLLTAHCLAQQTVEKTASDFTTTKLTQEELSDIFEDLEFI